MTASIKIAIIGDFNANNATHTATNDGIQHAAQFLNVSIEAAWLPTDETHQLKHYQGLFCSPGSPYRSLEGALVGIRYAREQNIPFLGTCGGFQHLILEYARNVLGFADAAHAESDPYASRLFITPLSCSLVGKTMEVSLNPGSKAATACRSTQCLEAFYCNFGLNPEYEPSLERGGLAITGKDQKGEARVVELASHPFYLGTLFVPQARSSPEHPHPLIVEFCRAATLRA